MSDTLRKRMDNFFAKENVAEILVEKFEEIGVKFCSEPAFEDHLVLTPYNIADSGYNKYNLSEQYCDCTYANVA